MKKTLLAAALMAGFAGVAQANTSVTLYGVLDTAVGYERIKHHASGVTSKRTGLIDGIQSGNRWGLKGAEDLGGGLRATFQLESGFTLTDGQSGQSSRLFGRHATVGLASDSWGQIDFGRQTTVGSRFFVDVHGLGWDNTGGVTAFKGQDSYRMDNSVVYVSPSYSGFQLGVGYSFNVNGKQAAKIDGQEDTNEREFTTGLRYKNGPIAAALTYDQVRLQNQSNPNSYKNTSSWTLSGSYDFEVVAVSLAFGQDLDGDFGVSKRYQKNFDYNNYSVALAVPVGQGKLSGSYTMSEPRKAAKDAGQKKQHAYSVVYKYPLSKRTDVYALGGYTDNYKQVNKDTRTVAAVGLRHRF